jgi:triphosphoribosyl-dephospho-CoA synthase
MPWIHLPAAVTPALERLPASCPPRGRGWCTAAAGVLEATAPKPGNVHPGAAFPDLRHEDLVAAALAAAGALEAAPAAPLGRTIREAVAAARAVTPSNANLGIILAIAPLAAADTGGPLTPSAVAAVLERLTPVDAADVWEAIGMARAGGLGTASTWDLRGPPPADLRAAMHAARDHDLIARLWADGYQPLFAGPVRDLAAEHAAGSSLNDAIVRGFLRQLAREPDSLIARRHGAETAAAVSAQAGVVLAAGDAWRPAAAAFDHALRVPRRLNPGTTADLIAAALYILLRDPTAGSPTP